MTKPLSKRRVVETLPAVSGTANCVTSQDREVRTPRHAHLDDSNEDPRYQNTELVESHLQAYEREVLGLLRRRCTVTQIAAHLGCLPRDALSLVMFVNTKVHEHNGDISLLEVPSISDIDDDSTTPSLTQRYLLKPPQLDFTGVPDDYAESIVQISNVLISAAKEGGPRFRSTLSAIATDIKARIQDGVAGDQTQQAAPLLKEQLEVGAAAPLPIPRKLAEARTVAPAIKRWVDARKARPNLTIVEHLSDEAGWGHWTRHKPGLPRAALLSADYGAYQELTRWLKEGNVLPDHIHVPTDRESLAEEREALNPEDVRWARRTIRQYGRLKARQDGDESSIPFDPEKIRKARQIAAWADRKRAKERQAGR